VHINK